VPEQAGQRFTARRLNRATLARQLLLRRSTLGVPAAIEHLVGLQAQAPFPPYTGLWTRLADFDPQELGRLLVDRSVVRTALLRSTVHLVTAADCLALRPVLQPVLDRGLRANFGRRLDGLDLAALATVARELVERQPRSGKDLGDLLVERWPDRDRDALANAARTLLPLVQVPPRAVWGRTGQTVVTTAEHWLGAPQAESTPPDDLVHRFLTAFGPATVADVQKWSGLTRLREVVDRLPLRRFTGPDGEALFDVPDAPLPAADTDAPVRFLPEFDNVHLAYAQGTRIMAAEHRGALMTSNGIVHAAVLVDGYVRALWRLTRTGPTATLSVEPLGTLARPVRQQIETEGQALLGFLAADAVTREIRW
jgi:hypothetical protein